MRFLDDIELSAIMGFPGGYFRDGIKLSKKQIIKLIGNAVPVQMAKAIIEPMKNEVEKLLIIKQAV